MAEFYKGFVFEQKVSPLIDLAIEGIPINIDRTDPRRVKTSLPSRIIDARSLSELARRYIDRSGLLRRRNALKKQHLKRLSLGRKAWNTWRRRNPHIRPVLAFEKLNRRFTDLAGYDFSYTNFCESDLSRVNMQGASFHQAILAKADLSGSHLEEANFCRTDLYRTTFKGAWLTGANLQGVQLAMTDLSGAHLRDCKIYGLSAWDLALDQTEQEGLRVWYRPNPNKKREKEVTVNSLDLAAFMYLTRNKGNISRVIEATGQTWVLLLGRFTGEGKKVLRALERELLKKDLMPIIFDFPRPEQRDLIETLLLLAGLSRFVIVEITDPKSTPLEILAIASNYAVPILPIIKKQSTPFGMFSGLLKYPWVRQPLEYESESDLIDDVLVQVIKLANDYNIIFRRKASEKI
jgi:Pentapeptide repeats (8 copies)